MSFRDTASYGKRQEYIAVAELLRRDFDVYMTLVDDQGIDCVIRLNEKRYLDIQIKARSKNAKNWNVFSAMTFTARNNLYFIFYTEKNDSYWIFPSIVLDKICYSVKTGDHIGKRRIDLPKKEEGDKAELFEKYRNDAGFSLLRKQPPKVFFEKMK
ncbi:MAG: hypothetical protein ABI265_02830 [Gallionella sp.]